MINQTIDPEGVSKVYIYDRTKLNLILNTMNTVVYNSGCELPRHARNSYTSTGPYLAGGQGAANRGEKCPFCDVYSHNYTGDSP